MCIAVLMVQAVEQFARAQETTTPSSAPAAEEKPRSERETKKRLEQLACGPSGIHFSHHTEKGPQALPEQPPERGLIYVIRTKNPFGAAVQARLAMDGKWVGVNRMANYFYLEADPGPHYFCMESGGAGRGLLSLIIEKGKTYYLRQNLTMGGIDLDLLTEENGKQYVAKYHRSVFEVKPKK